MEDITKEYPTKLLNELFSGDKELFDSAIKVFNIIRDFVDLVNDKYPGTTSEEVATIGLQLYWDACLFNSMQKEDIINLAHKILKSM